MNLKRQDFRPASFGYFFLVGVLPLSLAGAAFPGALAGDLPPFDGVSVFLAIVFFLFWVRALCRHAHTKLHKVFFPDSGLTKFFLSGQCLVPT